MRRAREAPRTPRAAALAVVGALALAASACGGGRSLPAPTVSRAPVRAPKVIPGELDVKVVLGDIPLRAGSVGAGPLAIVAAGEAVDGERIGAFVEVPADTCLLAYARGSTSVDDIDVSAFAEDGTPIMEDRGPDNHPTILLCPPHPDRVYLSAHLATGEGLVAIGAHVVPRDRSAEIARTLAVRTGDGGGPRPVEGFPGVDDEVRAHRALLGGKWEEFRKVAVTVDPRAPTFVNFPLEADQCVDAVVVPLEEVGPLEVEVMDGEGRGLARARDGGRTRTITLCSPASMTASLLLRPHVGRGLAVVALGRARGDVVRDLAARVDVAWTATPEPLDAMRAKRNLELAKSGYGPARVLGTGTLLIGRRAAVPLELKQDRGACERLDVVAGAPLSLVEAALWEDGGTFVASGEGSDGVTLFACARGKARLDLDARGRPGPYAVLARAERWRDASFALYPVAAARMLARASEGPRMLHEGAVVSTRAVTLEPSRALVWEETVPPGRCLRVTAGAQGEGTGLGLRLFDVTSSEELDRSQAPHMASVRGCAAEATPRAVKLELRVTAGKLDIVLGSRVSP